MTFTKGRDDTRQSWRWGWSPVFPLPSFVLAAWISLPPDSDPGFSDPSFLQGSVFEEPALKTALRSSLIVWHSGSMPGIAFSIIWASFSFSFSLVSVCSYYVSVSFSLSLTPIQGYGPARILSLSCLPWAWHTVCGQYRAVDGMTQSLCAYPLPLGKGFFFSPLNWIQPSKL